MSAVDCEPSDRTLISRVLASQDVSSFERLIKRHQSTVRNLLRRLVPGNHALADDLAQETFLRAYRGLKNYQGNAAFSSWLYKITYRVFLDDLKKRSRSSDCSLEHLDSQKIGTNNTDTDKDFFLTAHLQSAVKELRPEEQVVIALHYETECPAEEIAIILDCPVGTVKTNLLRAKNKLKEILQKRGVGHESAI